MPIYKLNDVCEFITDGTHQTPTYCEDGGVIFLSSKDVTSRKIDWENAKHIPDELHAKLYKRLAPQRNDILLAKNGTTGVAAIVDRDDIFNVYVSLAVLRPKKEIYPHYLLYAINSSVAKRQFNAGLKGIGVPNLHLSVIRNARINVCHYEQQVKICDRLEKISNIIEARKQELQLLDDLIKARFVEMFGDPQLNPFGWNVVNISEVVGDKVSNGFFAKRDDYVDNGNVSVLGVANVVNRMYSKIDGLPRTNADAKDIEKFEVKYGDMLFCRSSLVAEGIGKASIIPEDVQEKVLFECHVIRLPLELSKCIPEFMQALSTMEYFRNQVIAQSKTATMTTIGQDGILKTDIILPPIDKQREFYDFVKKIDKSKAVIQKALDKTQLLFDSLMQKYFG